MVKSDVISPPLSDCLHCPMRAHSIFALLTPTEIVQMQLDVPDLHVKGDTVLYRQGDPARYAYTLRAGTVKLQAAPHQSKDQPHTIRLLRHGDLLGFEGLTLNRHSHTAVTIGETDLCQLDLAELSAHSQKYPAIKNAIYARWQNALQEAETQLLELGAKKAEARIAAFLCRWCSVFPDGTAVPFPLNRNDLSEYLGLSTEHVSRWMAHFKRENLVHENKGSLKIDYVRLMKISQKDTSSKPYRA